MHYLKMPWDMFLRAFVTRIRHLSRMVRYLPCLADMDEAPEGIERANKELSEVELCQLIMRAIPNEWRESYRCLPQGHFTPADSDKLLRDLEPIETKDRSAKRKMVNGGGPPIPKKKFKGGGGDNGKAGRASASGGGSGGPRAKMNCDLCAKFGGRPDTHYTNQCRRWTKDGKPQKGFSQGSNNSGKNNKQFSQFMTFMSQVRAYEKKRAKDKKSKRKRKRDDSDSDSDSSE